MKKLLVEVSDAENASGGDAINLSIVPTEAPTAEILFDQKKMVFFIVTIHYI